MRVVSIVFGALLFVFGLIALISAGLPAYDTYGNPSTASYDWTCGVYEQQQKCSYGIGSAPYQQVELTALLMLAIAGAAGMVSGSVFILIGTNRRAAPAQPAAAQPPAGYPQQQQYRYPPGAPAS